MPTWVQWVSFGMAAVGSIFGVWAFILNYQRTTIVKRREKERLESRKKARFSVDRMKEMGTKNMQDKFVLKNIGESEARNVEVEFFNYERRGEKLRQKINPLMDDIPEKINSDQMIKALMIITGSTAPPFEIIITWDDDFSDGNKIDLIIN